MAVVLAHDGHVIPSLPVSTVALRWLVLLVSALVVCALLRGTAKGAVIRAAGVAVASAVPATSVTTWSFALVVVTHRAAAALWLGAVLAVAMTRDWQRLAPVGVVAAVAAGGSGALLAQLDRVGLDGFAFDRVVLVKAAFFVSACALGLRAQSRALAGSTSGRAGGGPGRLIQGSEAALLVLATVAGSLLALLPAPPLAGLPLVTTAGSLRVTIVPQRPGFNLVHVDSDVRQVVDGRRTTVRAGSTGQWAGIVLPAGRSTVHVGSRTVLVDAGDVLGALSPDGPECASAMLGAALAGQELIRCPAAGLSPPDRRALGALAGWLAHRGVTRVQVLGDSSGRSEQAVAALRSRAVTGTPGAVVLTGTWDTTARQLEQLSRTGVPAAGVFLAPWLLSGALLSSYSTTAPLLVLPFDPHSGRADSYLRALPPGEGPSAAGLAAFGGAAGTPQIWASAPVSILPKGFGHVHRSDRSWFSEGALTQVSRTLS